MKLLVRSEDVIRLGPSDWFTIPLPCLGWSSLTIKNCWVRWSKRDANGILYETEEEAERAQEKPPEALYVLCEGVEPVYVSCGVSLPIAARFTVNTLELDELNYYICPPAEIDAHFVLGATDNALKLQFLSSLNNGGVAFPMHIVEFSFIVDLV